MILFDNIIFSLQSKGGVSRFWANLIQGVSSQNDTTFLELKSSANNIYRAKIELRPIINDKPIPLKILRYINLGALYGIKKKCNYSLFHSSYYRVSNEAGVKNILTIHDFMYEKFISGPALWVHKYQKQKALRKADCLICVSENTKKDLLEFYPECVNKDIRVIPNGVGGYEDLSVDSNFNIAGLVIKPRSYFLYVGHRGNCKGFDRVYTVLNALHDIDLIVVGTQFSLSEKNLIVNKGFIRRIKHVGVIEDEALNMLYSNAEFFFFPSLYEGFGIPPIEAMKSNCPVVASNRSSIPDVVGDAALLFNPDSKLDIENAVTQVRSNITREYLIRKGASRALKFSWAIIVKQYSKVYSDYSV